MVVTPEQLDSSRSRLMSVLQGLNDDELNWKPDANTWSIAQVVQHIATVETGASKTILLGLAEEPNFVPSHLALEQVIPDRSIKVNAPPHVQPSTDPKTIAELKEILQSSRQKFMDTLNGIDNVDLLDVTSPTISHPVFGKMSTGQWILAAHLHEERHIRQIEEIKGLLESR